MQLLKSALFWRILVSFLVVVSVLGWGLRREAGSHEELEGHFDRLVQHDLALADDAEVLLRITSDLETSKRGYLLTHDRSFLAPYEAGLRDLSAVLEEARKTADLGHENALVDTFARDMDAWIVSVAQPQIAQGTEDGAGTTADLASAGKVLVDRMRVTLGHLREDALGQAHTRKSLAFDATNAARRSESTVILVAIALALASGIVIARDTAKAARQLQDALAATGRFEPLPEIKPRRDELGAVGESLKTMAAMLREKDASLRATLAERERTLLDLTEANAELAAHDAAGRAYAEFVAQIKTLDLSALAKGGLDGLLALAGARLGAVYLEDDAGRLGVVHEVGVDAVTVAGLPERVSRTCVPVALGPEELAHAKLSLGVGEVTPAWLLATPIAIGETGAGALVIAGLSPVSKITEDLARDAARQLGVALYNAWTYDRLRTKTRLLEEQGTELGRASRVKTEFLAMMGHELRTPLAAMIGFADLLLDSPKENLSRRALESIERIKTNGEHLLTLINDVLDLARVEAGGLEVRPRAVNVVPLARACVAEVESLRNGKDLRLSCASAKDAIEIDTDSQRLKQILLNLLSNALKFTERGQVMLTVDADASNVTFVVADTGIGIPEHAMSELFRDFHQLDVGDGRRFDGSGIGLALSRRLARALGGDITARSELGKGSTFSLSLPRSSAKQPTVVEAGQ